MWSDALERTAKGLVDSKEAAKNAAYIQALVNASGDPNSEGARGELAAYLDVLRTAQSMLTTYTSKTITVNGQTAVADGSPQTYFSATPKQQDDPYATTFFGHAPDPLLPGGASRDNDRIEVFGAQNGSATPLYVAEDLFLGGAVTNRVIGTLGRVFASLDVGLAGTAGASASGNLSARQLTEEGMALRLTASEQSLVGQLNGLADTNLSGAVREFASDTYFMRNGFTRLEGKCGSNCFDGVYVKGDVVYINEVKPLRADGTIKLNGPDGTLSTQMSDAWIDDAIQRLSESKTPDAVKTASLLRAAKNNGTLVKLVTGVNERGMTVVKLKGNGG